MGLFMLRKDSERRATLHRILTDYISHVISNVQESQVVGHCDLLTLMNIYIYISPSYRRFMIINVNVSSKVPDSISHCSDEKVKKKVNFSLEMEKPK